MRNLRWIVMAALLIFVPNTGLSAMEEGHSGHGQGGMDHSGHSGELIREATADGYPLAYHLIDMNEKMKDMKDMPEMTNTHHLMLYIKTPQGHPVHGARAGYLLIGPNGEKQQSMTMGMGEGYGGDVNLGKTGAYRIKTKIVIGDKTITDQFEHHVRSQ